ncbi:SPOR domain-containing protein [Porphyrobacter sp. YT40]|uniref:SPOR domain-containing protein n=1 Tax=Porphyrobacter sp. YT40 TaxID=2547601 RepID=UPI001142A6F6|nr:SPOR domain-containing protein [Porphyrobacter sp. YT40]QDH35598.1 SPOR domain-containing protein [Porphyrobacter sp. YT40]
MVSRISFSARLALGVALIGAPCLAVQAQQTVSQPVVQALPSDEVQRLNRALVALAKTPRDRDALIEAGQAALGIDDLEAAIGFFGRAAEVDPGHPGAAQGLGAVYLRAGRAGEALVQFERALAAGADERAVLTDQALTLDLVGEQAGAQAAYARALTLDPANDEARRRMAVSFAITGNRARFEEALRPLLDRRDMAAQRARAFGLAIMGDGERAKAIVEQVMPRDLATRLVPYLEFMPRLTKPQQAAAANLGLFPRAADIGRDDPRLARFAAEERADSRLAPSGPPLDARPQPVTTPAPEPARVATVTPVTVTTVSAPAAAPLPAPPPPPPAPMRVADAFAEFANAPLPDARVSGDAVDLSRIAIRREAPPPPPEKPKPKEPAKPVHPSRVWVQVATGKNVKALGFDWKRISKEGGATLAKLKPYTTPWGEANRLLAGPVDSRDKAQAMVRELKAKGVDSFLYVSPEGEEIQPVK